MSSVLFLTAQDPQLKQYWNTALIDGLIAAGLTVRFASWMDEELINLATSCSHICLITAAHYNQTIEGFTRLLSVTLKQIKQLSPSICICNDIDLTLWNSSKTYLLDLQAAFNLPRTAVADGSQSLEALKDTLHKFCSKSAGKTAIVKPSVGASGLNVLKIDNVDIISKEESAALDNLCANSRTAQIIIQEFLPDIRHNGELSLIYVEGAFVGAMLKQVAQDGEEYRVNSAYGGTARRLQDNDVPQEAKHVGESVLEWLADRFGAGSCAYMRLDVVMRDVDSVFVLMEVECIEPALMTADVDFCAKLVQHFKSMFDRMN